jgi:hypothetical protein
MILKEVMPLLCNERKISKYTRGVSRQRLGKHVPATTHERNDGTATEERRFLCGLCRDVTTWMVLGN